MRRFILFLVAAFAALSASAVSWSAKGEPFGGWVNEVYFSPTSDSNIFTLTLESFKKGENGYFKLYKHDGNTTVEYGHNGDEYQLENEEVEYWLKDLLGEWNGQSAGKSSLDIDEPVLITLDTNKPYEYGRSQVTITVTRFWFMVCQG